MCEAIAAVVFDLDGVLVASESVWDAARREVVARNGECWQADATRAMMGMSSPEWMGKNRQREQQDVMAMCRSLTARQLLAKIQQCMPQ